MPWNQRDYAIPLRDKEMLTADATNMLDDRQNAILLRKIFNEIKADK